VRLQIDENYLCKLQSFELKFISFILSTQNIWPLSLNADFLNSLKIEQIKVLIIAPKQNN